MANKTGNGYLTANSRTEGVVWDQGLSIESHSTNCDQLVFKYTPSGTLSSTGSEEEFLTPYITVYAWYRTA